MGVRRNRKGTETEITGSFISCITNTRYQSQTRTAVITCQFSDSLHQNQNKT